MASEIERLIIFVFKNFQIITKKALFFILVSYLAHNKQEKRIN